MLTRKYIVCVVYLALAGDHPVHFGLLCFLLEMTVQGLAELHFNLGHNYKDITAGVNQTVIHAHQKLKDFGFAHSP